jgi:hypothetical protein
MDFVWDKNHNLIYKTTRWWDGLPESDISVTQVHGPFCVQRVLRRDLYCVALATCCDGNLPSLSVGAPIMKLLCTVGLGAQCCAD